MGLLSIAMSELIIHVPHAATLIPGDLIDQYLLDTEALFNEAHESADLYTDHLARQAWPGATIIKADVCRIVVDVERYSDDSLETMAAVGRGMIYTKTHDGKPLRKSLSSNARSELQTNHYDSHWQKLRTASKGKILIDLHSYPVMPWSIESDPQAPRPEIDLGTSQGITPKFWIDAVRKHFEAEGYQVGENTPYAGVIDAGAKNAMMIEIRRDMIGIPNSSDSWGKLVKTLAGMPLPTD